MKYLYFSAIWCGPCRTLGPIMNRVGASVPVEKIDVDTNPTLAAQYGIRNIPTVVLVDNTGNALTKLVGVNQENQYISTYQSYS